MTPFRHKGWSRHRAAPNVVDMESRAGAIAAVLVLWIGVRLVTRRPVLHPWLAAIVLVGISALAGSFSESISGPAEHASYAVSALLGLTGLVAVGEGVRWELEARRSGRPRLLAIGAICLIIAIICGILSPPRDHLIAHTAGSAYLLSLLGVLFGARQRRIGAWLIALGIIAYACTRTVLLGMSLRGAAVFPREQVSDTAVILLIGIGLIAFVVQGARKPSPRTR